MGAWFASTGIEVAPAHWAKRYGIKGVPVLRATPGLPAAVEALKELPQPLAAQSWAMSLSALKNMSSL